MSQMGNNKSEFSLTSNSERQSKRRRKRGSFGSSEGRVSSHGSTNIKTIIEKAFLTMSLVPRPHQWRTLGKVIVDVASVDYEEGKVRNYLIQHPSGSGKSLTIACLALLLSYFKHSAHRRGFDTILVLNDRKILDSQLAGTIKTFLLANGNREVVQTVSSKHLASVIVSNKQSIIVSTVQKFIQLTEEDKVNIKRRRIALIVDEAHRSQGSQASDRLHKFLSGTSAQSTCITYFCFTCTPTYKTLQLFGIPSKKLGGSRVPFYSYPSSQAIRENIILDVLENYKTVNLPQLISSSATKNTDDKSEISESLSNRDSNLISPEEIVKMKANYIITHFIKTSKTLTNDKYSPKGMIVVSSRRDILLIKKALDEALLGVPRLQRFDVVCTFTPFVMNSRTISDTDYEVNGKYCGQNLVQLFKDSKSMVKLIVVAEKLQTGFDAPVLGIMYVDKVLKDALAVQTLGRLSRTAEGKKHVSVVDFHNTVKDIKSSHETFDYNCEDEIEKLNELILNAHSKNNILKNLVAEFGGNNLSSEDLEYAKRTWTPTQPASSSQARQMSIPYASTTYGDTAPTSNCSTSPVVSETFPITPPIVSIEDSLAKPSPRKRTSILSKMAVNSKTLGSLMNADGGENSSSNEPSFLKSSCTKESRAITSRTSPLLSTNALPPSHHHNSRHFSLRSKHPRFAPSIPSMKSRVQK